MASWFIVASQKGFDMKSLFVFLSFLFVISCSDDVKKPNPGSKPAKPNLPQVEAPQCSPLVLDE